jgi:hypothetical protein
MTLTSRRKVVSVLEPDNEVTVDDHVTGIVRRHDLGEPFRVAELVLDPGLAARFVQFRSNPPRFTPKIFDGDWALSSAHPRPGPIRIVRVITGTDGVSRAIGRQGAQIYASPWIG